MSNIQEEAMREIHSEERNADRERQAQREENNYEDPDPDELTPEQVAEREEFLRDSIRENGIAGEVDDIEIYKPGEPLLPKMMGEDYPKFFKVLDPEQAYEVEQERNIDHANDNKI